MAYKVPEYKHLSWYKDWEKRQGIKPEEDKAVDEPKEIETVKDAPSSKPQWYQEWLEKNNPQSVSNNIQAAPDEQENIPEKFVDTTSLPMNASIIDYGADALLANGMQAYDANAVDFDSHKHETINYPAIAKEMLKNQMVGGYGSDTHILTNLFDKNYNPMRRGLELASEVDKLKKDPNYGVSNMNEELGIKASDLEQIFKYHNAGNTLVLDMYNNANFDDDSKFEYLINRKEVAPVYEMLLKNKINELKDNDEWLNNPKYRWAMKFIDAASGGHVLDGYQGTAPRNKKEIVTDAIATGLGTVVDFALWQAAANTIIPGSGAASVSSKLPTAMKWFDRLKGVASKNLPRNVLGFNIATQAAYTPPEFAGIKERMAKIPHTSLEAAFFTGAGNLSKITGLTKGMWKTQDYAALGAIGWTMHQDDPELSTEENLTRRLSNTLFLPTLHGLSQITTSKASKSSKDKMQKKMDNANIKNIKDTYKQAGIELSNREARDILHTYYKKLNSEPEVLNKAVNNNIKETQSAEVSPNTNPVKETIKNVEKSQVPKIRTIEDVRAVKDKSSIDLEIETWHGLGKSGKPLSSEMQNRMTELTKSNKPADQSMVKAFADGRSEFMATKKQQVKTETPKVETPKVEAPKVAPIKAKTPEVKTPEVKTPKVEKEVNVEIEYKEHIPSRKEATYKTKSEFGKDLKERLNPNTDKRVGILTAEKTEATNFYNTRANKDLKEQLIKDGYKVINVPGKYGNKEKSFYVEDLSLSDAIKYGKKFNQESVATNEGLVYTTGPNVGKMNPLVKNKPLILDSKATDLYSVMQTSKGPQKFQINYNFDKLVDIPKVGPTIKTKEVPQPVLQMKELTEGQRNYITKKLGGARTRELTTELNVIHENFVAWDNKIKSLNNISAGKGSKKDYANLGRTEKQKLTPTEIKFELKRASEAREGARTLYNQMVKKYGVPELKDGSIRYMHGGIGIGPFIDSILRKKSKTKLKRVPEDIDYLTRIAMGKGSKKDYAKFDKDIIEWSPEPRQGFGKVVDGTVYAFKELVRAFTLPERLRKNDNFLNKYYGDLHGGLYKINRYVEGLTREMSSHGLKDRKNLLLALEGKLDVSQLNPKLKPLYKRVRDSFDEVGKLLVERGKLNKDVYEQMKGKYVTHVYLKHLLANKGNYLSFGNKMSKEGYLKQRKELSPEIQERLGKVETPEVPVATGLLSQWGDVVRHDYFKSLDSNPRWVYQGTNIKYNGRSIGVDQAKKELSSLNDIRKIRGADKSTISTVNKNIDLLTKEIARVESVSGKLDKRLWKQIPDVKGYGDLRGKWVNLDVHDAIVNFLGDGSSPKLHQKITAYWKVAKVAMNPPTVARNVMSNLVQMEMSNLGVSNTALYSAKAIREVVKDMRKKGSSKMLKDAGESGALGGTFGEAEITSLLNTATKLEALSKSKASGMNNIVDIFKAIPVKAGEAYGSIDKFFKLAKFMHGVERKGLSKVEAAVDAQKWVMDYGLITKPTAGLRSHILGAPFVTYQTKILPLILETAKKRPWKIAKYAAAPLAITAAALENLELSDQEWEQTKTAMSENLKEGQFLVVPWRDDKGRIQYMNLDNMVPWGAWYESAANLYKGKFKESFKVLYGMSPTATMLVASTTGVVPTLDGHMEVYSPLDTHADKMKKTAQFAWDLMTPGMLGTKYGAGKTTLEALGAVDVPFKKKEPTTGQAIASWFGMNVKPVDIARDYQSKSGKFYFKLKELETAYRREVMQSITHSGAAEEKIKALTLKFVEKQRELLKETWEK